jgi:hypothetical protein
MMEETNPDFVEAPIYMVSVGPFAGMYVASCARDRCGYIGKFPQLQFMHLTLTRTSVVLDYLYDKIGVPIKNYPRRGKSLISGLLRQLEHLCLIVELGEQIPPPVAHPSEDILAPRRRALGTSRPLKRSYAMLGRFINCHDLHNFDLKTYTTDIAALPEPARSSKRPTVPDLLERLDSKGITDTQFLALFARCECGLHITQRAFEGHTCIVDLSE